MAVNSFNLRLICLLAVWFILPAAGSFAASDLLEQSKSVVQADSASDTEWISEKTGQYLPLDLVFTDEKNNQVKLSEIVDRPTILLPIYFYCPNICSKNLANLAVAVGNLSFTPGTDYRVIALSFNDAEGPEDAARAERNYLKIAGEGFPADQWWFLTGDMDTIKAATDSVGFRFQKLDDETFIHPAALVILAADGKIIRYVYGSFLAGDIDMALSSAQSGTVAKSVKRLLDFCFNYDPDKNKSVFTTVKLAVLGLFGLGVTIFLLYSIKRRKGGKTGVTPQ